MKRAFAVGIHFVLAALCVFWLSLGVVSYWYCHQLNVGIDHGTSGAALDLRSTPGALECIWITFDSEPGRPDRGLTADFWAQAWPDDVRAMIRHHEWVSHGFGMHRWKQLPLNGPGPKFTNYYYGISLPFWLLAILCGIAPVLRWNPRRLRRRRRLAAGLCLTCGYDLRATPDRCPECGTIAGTIAKS
jgi:hypothetical protein